MLSSSALPGFVLMMDRTLSIHLGSCTQSAASRRPELPTAGNLHYWGASVSVRITPSYYSDPHVPGTGGNVLRGPSFRPVMRRTLALSQSGASSISSLAAGLRDAVQLSCYQVNYPFIRLGILSGSIELLFLDRRRARCSEGTLRLDMPITWNASELTVTGKTLEADVRCEDNPFMSLT
ncbi:hypothetical protein JB92DRAFT_2829857 [Gautieria morchelliformis]|nr:hypothetical protein JB92DRAFT_2829857 [Gautieria morchelliformis]